MTLARVLFSGLLVAGSVCVFAACSDDPATTTTTQPKPVCPNTVPTGVGAACNTEGYSCGVGFDCVGGFAQQATCTCTGGKYACKTSTGVDIPEGTKDMAPFCVNTTPPAETCPASVAAADGTTCKTAGKLCYFVGKTCPENSIPLYDVCMCRAGGDAGLAWLCETKTCAK